MECIFHYYLLEVIALKRLIRYSEKLPVTIVIGEGIPQSNWRNATDTAELECAKCGSWIKHWKYCSGKKLSKTCSVYGCTNVVTEGSHIINPLLTGVWIAPTCHHCNMNINGKLVLNMNVLLVNANPECSCLKLRRQI